MNGKLIRALTLLLALAGPAAAHPPQPSEEMAVAAAERWQWLLTIPSLTHEMRVTNLQQYYGQDFEMRRDPRADAQCNVYLVRRSKLDGPITFFWFIGSCSAD